MTVAEFHAGSHDAAPRTGGMVHCVNPFAAPVGSEHHKAQSIAFRSMARAREVTRALAPDLEVRFVAITGDEDGPTEQIRFDETRRLTRSITDLGTFDIPRPLPLLFDILDAVPAGPDDIVIFTNVDITLVPNFYLFLDGLFRRGADAAIVNRRMISNVYGGIADLDVMSCEVGTPHPGFDCFAFRGRLRDAFVRSDSCTGIGLVMLPLLYNLLALAEAPVALLDAHATFHLGDDRQWRSDRFRDYQEHNRREMVRVFEALVAEVPRKERLLARLRGSAQWTFPDILRERVGEPPAAATPPRSLAQRARHRLGKMIAGG